ncbi:MAG: tetratricopeptide repeat protein [Deltaproteobacteria bacterium]|nr:tetratricopeptide repeat protein [Deltaproteobacteria bacterium]
MIAPSRRSAAELVASAAALKQRHDWDALAALAAELPPHWGAEWLRAADEVAFAEGQRGRFVAARDLLVRAFEREPSHRRASALAYVHYAALLAHNIRKPRLDEPEPWRKGFERWITEALRLRPDSIVDRYRLGVYYASILTQKDTLALRAFCEAIALFERLPAAARTPRHRLATPYVRALYGAARSAYRLGRLDQARRWIFRCIRFDHERHHQKPVFKLFLAAKVLVAQEQLADAERALRLAVDAPHDGDRDFVYALLAEIALRQNRIEDAAQWIVLNLPAHNRKPYIWRLLGDCEARGGRVDRALKLYKSALLKDRAGRHKTLLRVGRLAEQVGQLAEARRAYEQAAEFRRRRYLSEEVAALEALARVCEQQGDREAARAAFTRMARLPLHAERAEQELARLAG